MKHTTRRLAAVLLSALCLTLCVGCNNQSSEDDDTPAYAPTVPKDPIDSSVPGVDIDAKIGETIQYQDKLTVTLTQVVEIDAADKSRIRVLMAEMTITNNSDAAIDCSTLTHFRGIVDGNESIDYVSDVEAAVMGRRYYSKLGDKMNFNQAIAPNETVEGYVYLGLPPKWDSLQVAYTPYKYYSNDRIIFTINEDELTHYDQPLG